MIITPKRKMKLFKFFKLTHLPYLPFKLGIETGNICNLKCPLCPTGINDQSMKKGFMNLIFFKKIIDQLKDVLLYVDLYSWGEPLLNPDFVSMVEYIKKVNSCIRVTTSTNLNIQDDRLLSAIVHSGIDEVIVSGDGITQETYSKYRVGGDYNLLMRNMKFMLSVREPADSKFKLIWNFLVFKHNEHEIGGAKKISDSLGVELRIGKMRTFMKDEILRPHGESIKKYKDWIPDNLKYSAYDKEKEITKVTVRTCKKPWQEITINWDGRVFPCCAVYGDGYSFGKLEASSIAQIWNNQMYIDARKEIIGKGRTNKTICGICKSNGYMHM